MTICPQAVFMATIPIAAAWFGARRLDGNRPWKLFAQGTATVLTLFVLAIAFPDIGLFYYSGPLASEGIESFAMPASAGVVLLVLMACQWLRVPALPAGISAALLGEIPVMRMGWIS